MENNTAPVWFITGCSTGFGRELAKLVLDRGWKAVITARNIDQIKDLANGFEKTSLLLALDVTKKKHVSLAVIKALKTFGKIDVLVNNA